jgi:hypothetical protein
MSARVQHDATPEGPVCHNQMTMQLGQAVAGVD